MNIFRYNRFRYIIITFAIITIASCNEKSRFDGYLYPIRENGLYGYIDSVGNRIIEPKYLWVSTFHNGLAMAVVDTIYREVPDSMAYEVGERDTVINMYRMYAKYGYIDKTGKFLIKPTFICYISMPQKGFHVKDLKECSNALYLHVFQNNRALFSDTITWKNGYIDKNGNVVISPKYYYSDPFINGKAIVMLPKGEQLVLNDWIITRGKLRSAYIDTTGNAITDFKYEKLTRFNGRCGIGSYKEIFSNVTGIKDGYTEHNYIIDENGTEIKDLGFWNQFYGFSKDGIGLARQVMRLQVFDGMPDSYSFVDEKGSYLEPLKGLSEYQLDSISICEDIIQVLPEDAEISYATHFNEGFAGISPDGKHWFVIDRYLLIHGYGEESVFEKFRVFNNGLAAVKKNGKWGFINKKIKEQIPCKYDSCGTVYPYLEEIFEYDIQGKIKKVAYINRKDSLVWESNVPKTEEIKNKYSAKERTDWGMWTYKYNPFFENIQIWIYAALGILFFIVIIVWGLFRIRVSSKQTVMPTNEQSVQMQTNINNSSFTTSPIDNATEDEDIRFYPSVGQYTEAIKLASQSPEDYFEKLSNLRPVFDEHGEPVMSSGNFAVVYKMVDENGRFHAVRCFHREQKGRDRSYKLICDELSKVSSSYLLPIKYLEKELFIDSEEYPVLLMDWVEGLTLDKYIRKHINDRTKLRSLAENFHQLAIWLLNQPFAHGDLKPDNILVKKDGSLVLVDYDGMFVPAMEGQKARELGSPDFRNPSRTESDFDLNIDIFPIVSMLLSLEMIAAKSNYLERFGKEDRLLFSQNDYLNLRDSGIFKRALASYIDDIPELAVLLETLVNGKQYNRDNVKKLLLTNNVRVRLKPNEEIERKASRLVGVTLFFTLFIPLYLRSIFYWHIIMLYIITILMFVMLSLVLVFMDRSRPNKNCHIRAVNNDGLGGCLCWLNILPLLLMMDSFTKWFNGVAPFLSQPYYEGDLYITAILWVIWWCSNMAIISLPYLMLKWRLKYFKTPEEKEAEQVEIELSAIRAEVEKEDKQWEKRNNKNKYVFHDDFPF